MKKMETITELEDDKTKRRQSISNFGLQEKEEEQVEFGQDGYYDYLIRRIEKWYREKLIEPQNKKLKIFHLVVSVTLFFDFFLTSFILGNYKFYFDIEERQSGVFGNHETLYKFICAIQGMDILLNFFKVE